MVGHETKIRKHNLSWWNEEIRHTRHIWKGHVWKRLSAEENSHQTQHMGRHKAASYGARRETISKHVRSIQSIKNTTSPSVVQDKSTCKR